MTTYILNFLISLLIGSMIFFTAVVSPSVFASLSSNASSKFLRLVFPRMFLFGIIITSLCFLLSILLNNNLASILLAIITLSFFLNRNYLTPRINKYRDEELEGNQRAVTLFKRMHLLSVLLFVLNFILLISIMVINYYNYN
tara:strand:- start:946 stop:1371 length:426 start_codon:yes stop_codon:yes gene_type:complete